MDSINVKSQAPSTLSVNHKCIRGKKRKSAKVYLMLNDKEYLGKHEEIMNDEENKEIYKK